LSQSSEITAVVLSALTEYGQAITVTDVDEGTFDYTTGLYTGDGTTDYSGFGLFLKYSDDEVDGTRIKSVDRKCIIAASGLGYIPVPGDIITDAAAVDYVIRGDELGVKTYEINGTTFAYVCPVRIR